MGKDGYDDKHVLARKCIDPQHTGLLKPELATNSRPYGTSTEPALSNCCQTFQESFDLNNGVCMPPSEFVVYDDFEVYRQIVSADSEEACTMVWSSKGQAKWCDGKNKDPECANFQKTGADVL